MTPPPPNDPHWDTAPLREAFMAWRRELVSAEQVETTPILGHDQPMDDGFADWRELKQQMQPGDELWTFDSPERPWREHRGWCGLVLVRSGVAVAFCITAQN